MVSRITVCLFVCALVGCGGDPSGQAEPANIPAPPAEFSLDDPDRALHYLAHRFDEMVKTDRENTLKFGAVPQSIQEMLYTLRDRQVRWPMTVTSTSLQGDKVFLARHQWPKALDDNQEQIVHTLHIRFGTLGQPLKSLNSRDVEATVSGSTEWVKRLDLRDKVCLVGQIMDVGLEQTGVPSITPGNKLRYYVQWVVTIAGTVEPSAK